MKKNLLFGLTGIAFVALLMLNASIVYKGTSCGLTLQNKFTIATAETETGGSTYRTKTTNTGTVTETANVNGKTYTRSCNYLQVLCIGTGSEACTPYFATNNCSSWVES